MHKKFFLILATLTFIFSVNITVAAYEFPHEFWELEAGLKTAVANDDYNNILNYGIKTINLMEKEQRCNEVVNVLADRYQKVAVAYAKVGSFESSADYFEKMIPYAKYLNWNDSVKAANLKIEQYRSSIRLFTDGGTGMDYNAPNEFGTGVLFGTCYNGETRKYIPNESMVLVYHEMGDEIPEYTKSVFKQAQKDSLAVEFALNCYYEGDDIKNFNITNAKLSKLADLFYTYKDVPVYLRFAAEFDIWKKRTDPNSFKNVFRSVYNYFKSKNSNVAIVWSPNQTSDWDINVDDYYPGDAYVDWVGISAYSRKYFHGDNSNSEDDELFFNYGINADPVIALRHIIETYGEKKPIMISESGQASRVYSDSSNKKSEDTSGWAIQKMKEFYGYIPMVYPQVKAIMYFDYHVNGALDDFRLSGNTDVQNEYIKLTKKSRFVQDSYKNSSGFCYREFYNGISLNSICPISAYVHLYDDDIQTVTYMLDNKYIGSSNEVPYTAYIDAQNFGSGNHVLKASVKGKKGKTAEVRYDINLRTTNRDNINVYISGDIVDFDTEPIIYNNRVMVPMRAIFENLGAEVSWDNYTKTATGVRYARTVKITENENSLQLNSQKISLDTPAFIMNGRTLVPIRAISEGLGCDVKWDEINRSVLITPKVFNWSEYVTQLPEEINEDMYEIEKSQQYSYREKYEDIYYTVDNWMASGDNDKVYGDWSQWGTEWIFEGNFNEVETKEESYPTSYHYAHYCTGNISNADLRYRTSSQSFCNECLYHDLGWFSSPLPFSEDSSTDYAYIVDGKRYRCSNTCFRWYLVDTQYSTTTYYRQRSVRYRHRNVDTTYGNWSDYSTNRQYGYDDDCTRTRTVYRYKEK